MNPQYLLTAILLCPLVGAIFTGFFLRRAPLAVIVSFATACIAVPFVLSLILVIGPVAAQELIQIKLFNWIGLELANGSQFTVPFAISLDRLSGTLLLIITGIGSLIHLYAGGYMHHEKGVYRFFSYLNLFVFSMLCLVLGSNMLVTFLGWEGVGVCSYLLIGYWFDDEANARAGMKAFIVNRVGDFGFLFGMFACLIVFGTLDYAELAVRVSTFPPEWFETNALIVTAIGACFLLAVTGKSAQLPLYIWLPDAMAGPTPVSALIHAATMVTSGIYLMTRVSFLLVHSETAMFAIAAVGAATALFAATIGLVQTDIKKVLAYSTVSQLGFMVLACGVGAFQFGVAHLMTHAFFKALLFLGAGSVIHAMHHEQDIRKMGGLIHKLPITGWTFVIGTLAIIGFPGFSGFFSKDEILASAFSGPFGHPVFWAAGAAAAACTSFYMVRLTWLVFFGKSRVDHHTEEHLHENTWVMTLPLIILAVLACVGGYVSIPKPIAEVLGIHGENAITRWLEPVLEQAQATVSLLHGAHSHESLSLEWVLMGSTTLIMLIMSAFAIVLYKNGPSGGQVIAGKIPGFYRLLLDKWRIDELYQIIIINPLKRLGSAFFRFGDTATIEGFINEGPGGLYVVTSVASDLQTGLVRNYVKLMFLGLLCFGVWIIW